MLTISIEASGEVILTGKDRVVAACIALQALAQAPSGEFKAFNPQSIIAKPKTLEDKLKYYQQRVDHESSFS